MKMLLIAVSALSLWSCMAFAESGRVTCTGILVPLELSQKAYWPLTVIYDAKGDYTCLVDWGRAGHDPLRDSCQPGVGCRVIGTYKKKIGKTYFIDLVESVTTIDAQAR